MQLPDPSTGWSIPGRYDCPAIHVEPGINHEVTIKLEGVESEAYFNVLDLLEVTLAAAWLLDREGLNEVLSRGRTHGFENPQIGDPDGPT